jgi:hypothetical protein
MINNIKMLASLVNAHRIERKIRKAKGTRRDRQTL